MVDPVHSFTCISVPPTTVLSQGLQNSLSNTSPLTVDFMVMAVAVPGAAFKAPIQITGLKKMYFPLMNGGSRRIDPKLSIIPAVEFIVWGSIALPVHVSVFFDGHTVVRVMGEIYPEVYPPIGRGWLDVES